MKTAALLIAAILLSTTPILAGPLTPPPGPITSTHKTLTEVEPRIAINAANTPGDAASLFKITQPGSYYLTGNITGVVGKSGIEIAASGVTIDLMGFDLVGVPSSLRGIRTTVSNLSNITILNGSVRNWGNVGVDLGGFTVSNGRIEGVTASGNAVNGIGAGFGCTITNCSAYNNGLHGIRASPGTTITNCSASNNTSSGISVDSGCTVTGCTTYNNIRYGILVGLGSTVMNCSVYLNGNSGISASSGCTVANCTVRGNELDGIVFTSFCLIRDNSCAGNGNGGDGAGIHSVGNDSRIEGNTCTVSDRGIDVDGSGNIIFRNTCAGNTTNWTIVANNVVGPILDRTAPASAAISGNSAPSSLASTDPNANFTF